MDWLKIVRALIYSVTAYFIMKLLLMAIVAIFALWSFSPDRGKYSQAELADDILNEDGIRPEIASKLESLPATIRVSETLRTPEQKAILRNFSIAASLSNQQLMDSIGDKSKAAKASDDYSYIIACSSKMYGKDGFDMVDAIDKETIDTGVRKYKALAASRPFGGQIFEGKEVTKEECFARFSELKTRIINPSPVLESLGDILNEDGIRPEVASQLKSLPTAKKISKRLRNKTDAIVLDNIVTSAARSSQRFMDSGGNKNKANEVIVEYEYISTCATVLYGMEGLDLMDEIRSQTRDTSERKYKALAASRHFRGRVSDPIRMSKEECFARFKFNIGQTKD